MYNIYYKLLLLANCAIIILMSFIFSYYLNGYKTNNDEQLGDPGIIIEIDEVKIWKRKYKGKISRDHSEYLTVMNAARVIFLLSPYLIEQRQL